MQEYPRFDSKSRDEAFWRTVEGVHERAGGLEPLLRHWPAHVMRRDVARIFAYHDLFKQVVDLPGCIVELGVFKGYSFFTWVHLLETYCATDRSRMVFGFDHFRGLAEEQFNEQDGAADPDVHKVPGGYTALAQDLRELVAAHNADSVMPGRDRCALIEGDVSETLPVFLEQNPGLKISLLHLDMDLYAPTKAALELLYPLVVKGGVVVLDEYGLIPWQGETRAVDEYFAAHAPAPVIRKFPFSHVPHGWFVKE